MEQFAAAGDDSLNPGTAARVANLDPVTPGRNLEFRERRGTEDLPVEPYPTSRGIGIDSKSGGYAYPIGGLRGTGKAPRDRFHFRLEAVQLNLGCDTRSTRNLDLLDGLERPLESRQTASSLVGGVIVE
jgi:hypothetical protein